MGENVGIKIDIRELSKGFYSARKSIRLGVQKALEASGPGLLRDVKKRAPVLRKRLKVALEYSVKYKTGEASISIMTKDKTVDKYFTAREFGPNGGYIFGDPYLAFVPRFSPFWSKTATVKSAKEAARSKGYTSFFKSGKLLLGVKRGANKNRKRTKGSRVNVGGEFVAVAIITPHVKQEGVPYIVPAFEANYGKIQDRIMKELSKIFNSKE